jgi:hypothetical protein
MTNRAPNWQIRCTRCGLTRDAARVGVVRIGARSYKKLTFGWCSACRWPRFLAIERAPGGDEAATSKS